MTDKKAEIQRLPYRMRQPFLSSTEIALFRALQEIIGDRYLICPKVALNDVFFIVRPNENVHFFNKIFRKHVDFLLCDPHSMAPAFGIEIVKPVSKTETRASDQFMDELFTSAGLPLVHVPSSDHYETADIVHLFQLAVTKIGGTVSLRVDSASDSVPLCPICGKMMVLRIHRGGVNGGKKYYGCMDNPHCAGVVALD
ncbi:MAG: DUF2726 domain-containing protein [Chloroflexi bacterium]|nr:DUF2726 domain-containing protein [Chloroflexota bacterium]